MGVCSELGKLWKSAQFRNCKKEAAKGPVISMFVVQTRKFQGQDFSRPRLILALSYEPKVLRPTGRCHGWQHKAPAH